MTARITNLPVHRTEGLGGNLQSMQKSAPSLYAVSHLSDIDLKRLAHAFRDGRDGYGQPLTPKKRELLTRAVTNPTSETWNDVYTLSFRHGTRTSTLWKSVVDHAEFNELVRPDARTDKAIWSATPTRSQLLLGLQCATKPNIF